MIQIRLYSNQSSIYIYMKKQVENKFVFVEKQNYFVINEKKNFFISVF